MTTHRVETAADLAHSALGLTAAALKQPHRAWAESLSIGREMLASLAGRASSAPAKGDKRFRDPVWGSNPAYRALMQSYLAWSNGVSAFVDGLDKVRFLAPVPAGAAVSCGFRLADVEDKGAGRQLLRLEAEARIEGAAKPAVVGEVLALVVA